MDMKRRILSCFLAFCMIFALLPAPAQAAGNAENATPTVTATVQHAATGQITAQIEAYMTDSANKTRTVKPCDIIFLIEQSKFMNTQNGSASSGDERAEILSAIDRLLDGMPQPTTGGEHRIAIAGYGRINNPGRSDGYNAALYPGTPSDNNDSLNTGYYTKDGTKAVFHSQSGWTEWDRIDGHTNATLPQLPSGYLTDKYDDVFLSVDNAKQVIDADKMVPWHAGAARMDAGLTITERLAEIAKAEPDGEDRNLIVCIAASSLPYQNSGTYQKLRPDAAIEAANTLKTTYGATIFGLGDFNKLNLGDSESLNDPDKQRDFFNDTMASICGNTSAHGADYFKGLSQVHDIDEALNELMTKIDANVGEGAAEELSIDVDHFTEGAGGYSWSQPKDVHHILSAGSIREVASVDYYRFTGYDDSSGTPKFESTPSRHTEQSLADIGRGNAIQTSLNILPIPPQEKAGETIRGANYGEKVVITITITDPVCIDYEWIGRWTPPKLAPPKHEHAARGTTHKPAAPTQNAVAVDDLNLKFDGWYRLRDETIDQGKPTWTYNGKTYVKYTGTVFPAFGSDLKLYGRWLPEVQVSFHWAGSVIPVDGDGNKIAPPSALSLSLNGDGKRYYQATAPTADGFEFDGWYKDSDCKQKFQEDGEILTANTNLYGRWTRLGTKTVTFKVQNGKWSNGTAEDKTVTVELRNGLGTLSAKDVPTGMTPVNENEYKTLGTWDIRPNTDPNGISETGNYVYTYTFPPKSKCTVTYHWVSTENPDSAVLPAPEIVTEDTTYTVETVSQIEGWTFSGWYDKANWTDTDETVKPGTYSSTGQTIDLYGKWTHNPCTVTFRADYEGAERGYLDANKQTVVLTYTVPYGSTLRKERISLPTPVPGEATYYFFKDWDLDNLFYTDPDVLDMPVRSNLTFVAQWWPIVTFDANGGAWSSGETMHYVKITDKVAAESTPVRNGYTFLGWYTDDGNRANFEDTVNGPKTLYAHWAKNAAVTFRIVNGTWSGGAAEDKTVTVVLYPQADGTASGTLDASYVPQIMLPAPGYENTAGGWEQTPNTDPNGITGDVTYVYRFGSTGGGGSSSGHSTRYTLHYESNGGTAYKDERCSSGTKVTLDKTPTRESYTFTGWYSDKALTQKITSVTMNSDKTVYAGWEATGVPDKLNGDDHFAYVVGYSDSTVRPNANISRAEVATIFFRLLKADIRDGNLTADNEFSDVSDGQWHNKAISTMAKLGIVKGRRADRFDPDASITRAEFAAICARFSTRPVENSGSFSDISGHWAENEIERAAAFGWISGYPDGTFRPDARITRAEAMTMINRVLCRMPQSESDLLDSMVTWPDNKPSDWHYLAVQEATNSHDFDRQGEVGESWTKLTSVPDWTRYQ